MLSAQEALVLHNKVQTPENVIAHCTTVAKLARDLAGKLNRKNPEFNIDEDFVYIAGLLHDIGRSVSHGIDHGVIGARIIRTFMGDDDLAKRFARVCETHIGAGISPEEAEGLGLPAGDYIPQTIEEKLIAYADNMVEGDRVRDPEWAEERFRERFGNGLDSGGAVRRVADLNSFFKKLL